MPMISLTVMGSINQSKSMPMMSPAVVGSIKQSKACKTHKSLLWKLTMEANRGSLPQELTVEAYCRRWVVDSLRTLNIIIVCPTWLPLVTPRNHLLSV